MRAKRLFYDDRSTDNRAVFLTSKTQYNKTKRTAKRSFNMRQRENVRTYAKYQPLKFWNEIKKINNRRNDSDITPDTFFEHFKNLFSSDDVFSNVTVEEDLSNLLDSAIVSMEFLDSDFTVEEVMNAIGDIKRGKSGGFDQLIPEIFIDCKEIISPVLCKLFNYIYSTSSYTYSWSLGVIVPAPKKGDKNDVNNYRGITLTSIFSKIFSILLDRRVRKWLENKNKLSDFQFGFRNDKSTIDCIFVLNAVINRVVYRENRQLYCAFVDFKKAFDLVYRNGILYKLLQAA